MSGNLSSYRLAHFCLINKSAAQAVLQTVFGGPKQSSLQKIYISLMDNISVNVFSISVCHFSSLIPPFLTNLIYFFILSFPI
jgi:hypothetical protein